MNSTSLFAKISLSSSLLLASPALAQAPADAVPVNPNFRTSNEFNFALGHLEGATDNLSVIDLGRRVETWSGLLGDVLKSPAFKTFMEDEAMLEEAPRIDLDKALDHLGVDNLTTYAMGTEQTNSGWVTRNFLGMNGKPKGILTLGGTKNQVWQATRIARKEDDLIIEFTIDTEQLGQWLLKTTELINESIPAELKEELEEEAEYGGPAALISTDFLTDPMLPTGESILEALTKIGQPRFTLIVNIPPDKDMPDLLQRLYEEEDVKAFLEAGASLTLAIDQSQGLMEIMEPLLAQFDTAEENGLQVTRFLDAETREMQDLPESFLTQLSYNPASSLSLLELGMPSTQAPGSIKDSADFTSSTALFPQEGTSLSWVSDDFINSLYIAAEVFSADDEEMEATLSVITPLIAELYGIPPEGSSNGLASASYWIDGGMLSVSTSPSAPADLSVTSVSGMYMAWMFWMFKY